MARTLNGCLGRKYAMDLSLDEYIQQKEILIDKPADRKHDIKFKAERRAVVDDEAEEDPMCHSTEGTNNGEVEEVTFPNQNGQIEVSPAVGSKFSGNFPQFPNKRGKSAEDLRLKLLGKLQRDGTQPKIVNTRNWTQKKIFRANFNNLNNNRHFGGPFNNLTLNNFNNGNGFQRRFENSTNFRNNTNNSIDMVWERPPASLISNLNSYSTVPINQHYANFTGQRDIVPLMSIQTGMNSVPLNYQQQGVAQIKRDHSITLVVPKLPEIIRRVEDNPFISVANKAINGYSSMIANGTVQAMATNAAQLLSQAVAHKPIYDLGIQGAIHAIQHKPLKCSNFGPISSNGPGIDSCQITPHLGCISLHNRFT